MIPINEAVIARYKRGDLHFEILVGAEPARELKSGKELELEDVIASRDIFSNLSEGKKASDEDLNKAFATTNIDDVIKRIIQKGEIQITTEQKKKMQEVKKKQVLNMIAKSAVDPRTHIPHPLIRLEKTYEESNYHIDPFKSSEEQMPEVLTALKKILPIKMETVDLAVHVPAQLSGPVCGYVHKLKRLREQWGDDGSYYAVVELPAGLKPEFEDKVNKMTHGEVEIKVIERK